MEARKLAILKVVVGGVRKSETEMGDGEWNGRDREVVVLGYRLL